MPMWCIVQGHFRIRHENVHTFSTYLEQQHIYYLGRPSSECIPPSSECIFIRSIVIHLKLGDTLVLH